MSKKRARIYRDGAGVTLEYTDYWLGEREKRHFHLPSSSRGGYVVEIYPSGRWEQVCEELHNRGATLWADSQGDLIRVIRREYRAMRRREKKEDAYI